jgi:hypothetical protein
MRLAGTFGAAREAAARGRRIAAHVELQRTGSAAVRSRIGSFTGAPAPPLRVPNGTLGRYSVKARSRRAMVVLAPIGVLMAILLAPATAAAHGPVNPAASSYLATVRRVPAGLEAKVVDGDLRMWLQVRSPETVEVLDYRGAPYLRFSRRGVQVNQNSSMYYLNQVPVELVPRNIGLHTPPRWIQVSSGHAYEWHDGRLHAGAVTALRPGSTYAGRWIIPVRIDGRQALIAGGLRYAPNPSIVWFWPIVVTLICVLAGIRLRRRELDVAIARGLAAVAIAAFIVEALGKQLHGRPSVSVGQLVLLAFLLAFATWAVRQLVLRRNDWLTFFLIALAALYEGLTLITVLVHGFVLIALPSFVARGAVVVSLAAGVGLLPVAVFRLAQREDDRQPVAPGVDWEDEHAWEREA